VVELEWGFARLWFMGALTSQWLLRDTVSVGGRFLYLFDSGWVERSGGLMVVQRLQVFSSVVNRV